MDKTIQEMTDLELALLLDQQYQTLMQTQNNLMIINQELEKRKKPVEQHLD
jgi:hypothetical protein